MPTVTCRDDFRTATSEPTVIGVVRRELPCRADNPDLWFAETPAELEQAKSLCVQCPIRARCLSAALDREARLNVTANRCDSSRIRRISSRDELSSRMAIG